MMPKLKMNHALLLAFLIGLPGALVNSPNQAKGAESTGLNVQLGGTDFVTYCAACHGVSGKGDGTIAEFLTITAADLTQLKKKNTGLFPRERLIEVIDGRVEVKVHGPRDMPVWGDWFKSEAATSGANKAAQEEIAGERIKALVDYIELIQEQ